MVLRICLDTTYFAENWKLITENIIAIFFFKRRNTVLEHYSRVFVLWLVHEQCHGISQKNANATSMLGKRTLSARLDSVFCAIHASTFHTLWVHGHCSWEPQLGENANLTLKLGPTALSTHLKNYFTTVFSVFNNKRYLNRP